MSRTFCVAIMGRRDLALRLALERNEAERARAAEAK